MYKRKLNLPLRDLYVGFEVLFPAQQEVLCSEYIRIKGPERLRLKHLLLPVGRGMKSIDIFGSTNNGFVLGQVSFSNNPNTIKEKIESLKEAKRDVENKENEVVLVYFGPPDKREDILRLDKDLEFVSLKDVFDEMRKETGILNDMLGINIDALEKS